MRGWTWTPGGVGAMPPHCLPTASASFLILNPTQPPFGAHTLNGVPFAIEPDAEVSGFAVKLNATLDREWNRSEEHTSELQSRRDLVCRLLLEKKKRQGISVLPLE